MKVNQRQLPVKAHFFFFMAAMGPILPFLPVYGKQLGVSPLVMGSVSSLLPIVYLIAKPCFGLIMDRFSSKRKPIFVGLLAATSGCFVLMHFLPAGPVSQEQAPLPTGGIFTNVSRCIADRIASCFSDQKIRVIDWCEGENATVATSSCEWRCQLSDNFNQTIHFFSEGVGDDGVARLTQNTTCTADFMDYNSAETKDLPKCNEDDPCQVFCQQHQGTSDCLYGSPAFWGFIVIMFLGNVGFNVSNCISDAICFDVLGKGGQMSYGRQRVWGSIGFGITAFLAGYAMDWWSGNALVKSYTPAFILITIFSSIDLLCCSKLQLPSMGGTESILKDVWELVQVKPIAIFLCFATVAGILDSFIIYFLFWYLEDLAKMTGHMHQIKLIEGLTVLAETLGGEVIFFSLSGKILSKIGYGYSFALCFAGYALRLGLISLAPSPGWIVLIELFMQGPTYALCYTTIVAYASAIAPTGTSATVQGVVAGMDDGLGYALGSMIGGLLYREFGGAITMRIYACLALFSSITYLVFHLTYLKHAMPTTDPKNKVEWKSPEEAAKACHDANEHTDTDKK
ncbi:hypothetical protein QAD02_020081 [Eretmocerus hayati]|uniref:Uncharacterized protein n=1 Tax=Eretmocerus hayati TaxID=131215 RepID=A0ACC2PNW8_9HYME|nr:hypothetical protein QAD02_020081 [Eretmocerus hayati]